MNLKKYTLAIKYSVFIKNIFSILTRETTSILVHIPVTVTRPIENLDQDMESTKTW